MRRGGFSLIECLVGLSLSLFVITAGLQFFVRAQGAFAGLKSREEADQAALAALDRMRIDLLHAGRGLSPAIGLGLVKAAEAGPADLRLAAAEKELHLAAGAAAGATWLALVSTADVATGQGIVLCQGAAGEVRTVVRAEAGAVVLESPLERDYSPDSAAVCLLERVTYFLDGTARILRRRVNASPAQPVVESVAAAAWSLDPLTPLVRIRLDLDVKGVHPHETTIFLKNAALAGNSGR